MHVERHGSAGRRVANRLVMAETRSAPPPGVVPEPVGPGEESVWDYPRPPRVEPVAERVRVIVGGRELANSVNALRVLETAGAPVYYLPPADVDFESLSAASRTTFCEWKGTASYYDFDDGIRPVHSIGWTYRDPLPGFESIRDHVAFYASKVDEAWVGDEQATPQPGRYYGGWVTKRIRGPIKGVPGSEGW
jgi:uncharacterized protein (DUF427 family)